MYCFVLFFLRIVDDEGVDLRCFVDCVARWYVSVCCFYVLLFVCVVNRDSVLGRLYFIALEEKIICSL